MAFAFRAKNLGPLREIDWRIPPGVSVVVGPNGVGKSTLLRLPEFARVALTEGLNAAVMEIFEGTAYLRHHRATSEDKLEFGLSIGGAEWDVVITVAGGVIADGAAEEVRLDGHTIITRAAGKTSVDALGHDARWGTRLIPCGASDRLFAIDQRMGSPIASGIKFSNADEANFRALLQIPTLSSTQIARIGLIMGKSQTAFSGFQTYHYQLTHTAKYGSQQSSELKLLRSGENVFPLLRNWRDRSDYEPRYEFVLSTLREAFPHVKKLDFEQAGQTVTVAVVDSRYPGKKTPISRESTGFLVALLHLCAIASCPEGGLVTLDELETSLHPHAIKVLIAAFRSWAQQHDLSIVLATQSETVLDQFHDEPEKIFVLEPKMTPAPKPLTDLFSREWLSQFSLGDLFGHLEYGSHPTE